MVGAVPAVLAASPRHGGDAGGSAGSLQGREGAGMSGGSVRCAGLRGVQPEGPGHSAACAAPAQPWHLLLCCGAESRRKLAWKRPLRLSSPTCDPTPECRVQFVLKHFCGRPF